MHGNINSLLKLSEVLTRPCVHVYVRVCVLFLSFILPSIAFQESSSSNTVAFMHQMIPHHENAVNMARILLQNPGDEELDEEVGNRHSASGSLTKTQPLFSIYRS